MIDPSGRLLGRIWHGCQLELFDRVFFCFVFLIAFTMKLGELFFFLCLREIVLRQDTVLSIL